MKWILRSLVVLFLSMSAFYAQARAFNGGADAGGGNTVGPDLFDDYENQGVTILDSKQVENLVAPYLKNLEAKVPGFAESLREGLTGTKWYLDPKPLAQTGACLNETNLAVPLVVRACQTILAVRIDKDFFEANPQIQAALLIHELLVFKELRSDIGISDEGVREVSRQLRSLSTDEVELRDSISRNKFGRFFTSSEREKLRSLQQRMGKAGCLHDPKARTSSLDSLRSQIRTIAFKSLDDDEYRQKIYLDMQSQSLKNYQNKCWLK